MGRTILVGALGFLSVGAFVRFLVSPGTARAQSVEQASAELDKTQHALAQAATQSATTATAVERDLGTTDSQERLPAELTEFARTTQRLEQLRAELAKDIAAYDAARTAKLTDFDAELKQINDPATRRHMERLRARAQRQTTEHLQTARAALERLHAVLTQGSDLQHAATCVQLADDLRLHGTELSTQVQRARDQVAAYQRLTTTLIAKLTTTTSTAD